MTTQIGSDQKVFTDYHREGYIIVRGLFPRDEIDKLRDHFTKLAEQGANPPHWTPEMDSPDANDPNRRWPRMMMPHRYDPTARRFLLDPRIRSVLQAIMGEPPLATQSMYYFKPPGARGQAMHQDNYYLIVKPTFCYAAWIAIDPATPENGSLSVVPHSHKLDTLCPDVMSESETSMTAEVVSVPEGYKTVQTHMEPGDVLFFNGQIIHGSGPNRSESTWRRSLILHYMPSSSTHIGRYFHPVLDFEGNEIPCKDSTGAGPCGTDLILSYAKWD